MPKIESQVLRIKYRERFIMFPDQNSNLSSNFRETLAEQLQIVTGSQVVAG